MKIGKLDFCGTFSFGNLITLGTIIVALAVGWTRLDAMTEQNSQQIAEIDQRTVRERHQITTIQRDVAVIEEKVRQLEYSTQANGAKLDQILMEIRAPSGRD
ncbi:hypothetical protein HBA54_03130 [Pelagibius litoralis]|uniref:Uncharacterized protein n=1 Tax=Pelagibius litoralis TaxID=374515 RepID=A0A967C3H9_9PROT|nr:hypothetical protein [Pelagibius litoralis]NIA67575.1 hypothetical protein [Pelagibius litoralis]